MPKSKKKPNPGSPEAVKLGCKCPILDNAHGKGYMCIPNVFVMSDKCPIHGKTKTKPNPSKVNNASIVAWEVEINYMSCVVFASTKAKAKWIAVKSYWEAYSRDRAWPNCAIARRPQYDRFPYPDRRAYSPEYVRDLC